jgi:hypothetical protein
LRTDSAVRAPAGVRSNSAKAGDNVMGGLVWTGVDQGVQLALDRIGLDSGLYRFPEDIEPMDLGMYAVVDVVLFLALPKKIYGVISYSAVFRPL